MKYHCPACNTELEWDSKSPNRPFCSEQCKNKDFIGWANESHMIEGASLYDDVLSGDIEIARLSDYKKDL